MNRFVKYCPNVWVAECDEMHEKGEVITLTTKYGKEVECEVYNLLKTSDDGSKYYYSIVRLEDKTYAERKAEKYNNASQRNIEKSLERLEAAQEGKEFLSLGEPIKVGHHSEKSHRALIERNWKRIGQAVEFGEKAEEQKEKAEYWEEKAKEITLAMPESLEYFKYKFEEAEKEHKKLKDNPELRFYSDSLKCARKQLNEFKKKFEIAEELWG